MEATIHHPPSLARKRPNLFRMVLCLAVLQCALWVSFAFEGCLHEANFITHSSQEFQVTAGVLTFMVCGVFYLTFRKLTHWTYGRFSAFSSAVLILTAQILIWMPVVDTGCTSEGLCLAQSVNLTGLWIWFSIWVWWSMGTARDYASQKLSADKRTRFKSLLSAFGLYPFVVGGFAMTILIGDHYLNSNEELIWGIIGIAWSFAAILTWLWIWRKRVIWTPSRKRKTLILAALCVLLSFLCQWVTVPGDLATWIKVFGPVLIFGAWIALTTFFWSGGTTESFIECARCGYNLKGLHSSRCPECGHAEKLEDVMKHSFDRLYGGIE